MLKGMDDKMKFVRTSGLDIELIAYSASSGISSLSWISLMV